MSTNELAEDLKMEQPEWKEELIFISLCWTFICYHLTNFIVPILPSSLKWVRKNARRWNSFKDEAL